MDTQIIKNQMTLPDIVTILEDLGCEKVSYHGNYVTSTKGGYSDNPSGVVVWDNGNFFNAEMYTTPEFDNFQVHDIFSVIQAIKECNFNEAKEYVLSLLSLDRQLEEKKEPDLLCWLNDIEKSKYCKRKKENFEYDLDFLHQFIPKLHEKWYYEGINLNVAKQFLISYDSVTSCIIIPIRDEQGNLAGCKMRETLPAENKYCYALPTKKSNILYGLFENREKIKEKHHVLVFEAEKSVLKACSMGIENCVALGGKIISDEQSELLNKLDVPIVLALDEDVSDNDINVNIQKLSFPFPLHDVYVYKDERLNKKESPADRPDILIDYKRNLRKVESQCQH